MKEYKEYLQFSLWVSDIKTLEVEKKSKYGTIKKSAHPECIRGIWNSSGSKGPLPVGVKKCSFEEYVDLLVTGHSVRRVNLTGDELCSRFLFIDLDNDIGENVTEEELYALKLISNNKIVFYPSTSGRAFRWHLYILTRDVMHTKEDLEKFTMEILGELERICNRKITCDSKCYTNWHQVCYGMPQKDHYKLSIPDGTEFIARQILKEDDPDKIEKYSSVEAFFSQNHRLPASSKCRIVPYNSKMLSRMLGVQVLIDKSFSIRPPSTYKSKLIEVGRYDWKIKEGKRYHVAQTWIFKLVPQWYKCNLKYNMGYTLEDLEYTMRALCKSNFEKYEEFDMKGVLNGLRELVKRYRGKTYEEIEGMSEGQIRIYRDQHYLEDLIGKLANEYMYDECTIMFRDRREMREALKRYQLSEKCAKRRLNARGFDIQIMMRRPRESKIDFDRYPQNEKGQYLIPADEVTPSLRNRASKMKIKIKSVR